MRKLSSLLIALPAMTLAAAAFAVDTPAPAASTDPNQAVSSGSPAQELGAAVNFASQATSAKDITSLHEQLQSVVTCLLGPQVAAFDPDTANPCRSMGTGVLKEIPQGSDESRLLNDALDQVRTGMATIDVDAAHSSAKKMLSDLQSAETAIKQ